MPHYANRFPPVFILDILPVPDKTLTELRTFPDLLTSSIFLDLADCLGVFDDGSKAFDTIVLIAIVL